MYESKKAVLKFADCISNTDYPASLERHKIYRVLPDEDAASDGDIRIVDESGEDYLFPTEYFVFLELPKAVEKVLIDKTLPYPMLPEFLTKSSRRIRTDLRIVGS